MASSGSSPWSVYLALSDRDQRDWGTLPQILNPLLSALQAPGHAEPPPEIRRRLLSQLLATLSPPLGSVGTETLTPSSPSTLLLPILSLVKALGRSPSGSEELARERGITTLLVYGGLSRVAATLKPRQFDLLPVSSEGLGITELLSDDKDDPVTPKALSEEEEDPLTNSEEEALRALCNILMLHPSARELFSTVLQQDKSWVAGMVRLLGVKGAGFLVGRLLFLLTSKQSEWIGELAERGDVVDALEDFAVRYVDALRSPTKAASLSSGPMPTRTDILREHLKLIYNLMLQYGRLPPPTQRQSSGDDEDTSEASDTLPGESGSRPDSPAIGSGSKTPKKKPFWKSSSKDERPSSSRSSSPSGVPALGAPSPSPSPSLSSSSTSKSPRALAQRFKSAVTRSTPRPPMPVSLTTASADGGGSTLTLQQAANFLPLFQPCLSLAVLLPLEHKGSPAKDPSSLLRCALNTLLNFPLELEELDGYSYSWLQPVEGVIPVYPALPALPSRLFEVLEWTFAAWFPVNKYGRTINGERSKCLPSPPDELVPRGGGEAGRAEEIIAPIMLLTRKLSLLTEAGDVYRDMLLPPDMDRTLAPDQQPNMLGHLVRLMGSILLPNTAYGAGELLYNLCDRDPATLSTQIGYGNAAGFLQNRGELVPPPPAPVPSSNDDKEIHHTARSINPITGAFEPQRKEKELSQMTDEEKEREAERLYVLFDRMSKTGVMDVENPINKAKAEGKLDVNSSEEQRRRAEQKEQDEQDEREVEAEMKRYKERKRQAGGA